MDRPVPSDAVPSALAAAGVGLGYAAILFLIAVVLFVLPFLAFRLFGVAA